MLQPHPDIGHAGSRLEIPLATWCGSWGVSCLLNECEPAESGQELKGSNLGKVGVNWQELRASSLVIANCMTLDKSLKTIWPLPFPP